MSRDEAAYVADMLEACERICSYVADLNERTLRDDTKTVDAIFRNLAVLGEAAKRVSDPTRSGYSLVSTPRSNPPHGDHAGPSQYWATRNSYRAQRVSSQKSPD